MRVPDQDVDQGADLVIVSSPLQYINAVEQRRSSGGRPADLVLIGDRHGAGETIRKLMRRQGAWRSVHRLGRRPRPHKLTPLWLRDVLDAAHRSGLRRLAKSLSSAPYRTVVIGDYRNVSQRLVADLVPHDEFVLVDDGSVTPQVASWRADAARATEPKQFDLSWFRTDLARRVFGDPPLAEPRSVTFHSIYGAVIADRLASADRIVAHRYEHWSRTLRDGSRSRTVWFLGSDHAEAGICAEEDYFVLVRGAISALEQEGHAGVVYRPHRGESAEKVSRLAQQLGLTVVRTGLPVEVDYLDASEKPGLVAAIASSALDALSVMDPGLPLARIVPPPHYLRKRAAHIHAVISAHDAFNANLRVLAPDTADKARR